MDTPEMQDLTLQDLDSLLIAAAQGTKPETVTAAGSYSSLQSGDSRAWTQGGNVD